MTRSQTITDSPCSMAGSSRRCAARACASGTPTSRRTTTEVSRPIATRPALLNAPPHIAQLVRPSLRIRPSRPDPRPIEVLAAQYPDGFTINHPPLDVERIAGADAEFLAERRRQGRLSLGRDRYLRHAG